MCKWCLVLLPLVALLSAAPLVLFALIFDVRIAEEVPGYGLAFTAGPGWLRAVVGGFGAGHSGGLCGECGEG